ncbi:hypothetical protein Tco_1388585 [Tanacetum coccineum]
MKLIRSWHQIDQDPGISLVQHDVEIQGRYGHDMEFDLDFDAAKEVSTAEKDANLLSQFLLLVHQLLLLVLLKSAVKDKGKGKIVESKNVHTKTKLQQEQERLDFEAAVRLQDKLEEEERIEADEELAQRLQVEEREKYSETEQARMIAELINQRKSYFVKKRAKERRNKPPTQAQQRTYMSNYIKHIGESEVDRAVIELAARSSKRAAKEELDQEISKRQKTSESLELAEELRDKEAVNCHKKSYNK